MRSVDFAIVAFALAVSALSCYKADTATEETGGINLTLSVPGDPDIAGIGFNWNEVKNVNWISGKRAYAYKLKPDDIRDENTVSFHMDIPGLASGDVRGYFAVNIGSDGVADFTVGGASGQSLSLLQEKAGTLSADHFFLFSSPEMNVLKKGSDNVELEMSLAGSILAVKPFSSEYPGESVRSVAIVSDNPFIGEVEYDHSDGTVFDTGKNTVSSYKIRLKTPFGLGSSSPKDNSSTVFFSLPAGTLGTGTQIVVTTNVAEYCFVESSSIELERNRIADFPLNLDKARREPFFKIVEPDDAEDDKKIRTIDRPKKTYFLPRRWKSGMNNPSNSWYKYWSDYDGVWNTSNTNLWLPNCTHYCMGRSAEIAQRPLYSNHEIFSSGFPNAQNWYKNTKWTKGSTPKLGAICVWSGGQYGHVAIVEGINNDGSVNISQSNYRSTDRNYDNPNYFIYKENLRCSVGSVTQGIGWTFSGYIYNPYVVELRTDRNPKCSQVQVSVDALVVRNDNMVATGLSALQGYYNVYDSKEYNGYVWVKIADNAWIALNEEWNTLFY